MPATKSYNKNLFRKMKLLQSAVYKQPLLFTVISLCAGSFLAFSKLASEVLEGEGRAIDTQIMLLLRDPNDSTNPLGPGWFEEMMRDISGLGGVAMLTFITLVSALVPHGSIVYTASFPSGHSLIAAIYLTLAIVMTLLIGISRVYLGVHWPSDVVAGWLGGSAWAFMFWIISHYARKLHLQK
jgi:undecaprenyl-diphosphatase